MWLLFFPQFLVDGRDSQEVKGMILSLYLIVAKMLAHVVSFLSLGMLREKKDKPLTGFFFPVEHFCFIFFHKYSIFTPEIIFPEKYQFLMVFTEHL